MDAAELAKVVAELRELSAGEGGGDARVQQIKTILTRLKSEVTPTEDLLRSSKAGVAVGKLRTHADSAIQALSKEIVKQWKETIDENKRKRKRDDGEVGVKKEEGDKDVKRVKAESSNAGSPSGSDTKPKKEATGTPKSEGGAKQDAGRGGPDRDRAEYRTQSPPSRPKLSTIDSTRTVPRTAKTDGNAASLKATPDDGDDIRHKIVVQFYDALAGDSTAEKKILVERAQAIEKEVWQKFNGSTANDYRQKCRSLFLNLKDKGNPALRNEIVLGSIGADKVVNMSKEEMASESVRAMNEKIAMENLFKAKAVGETQAETDAFKCGRCQQRKCTYYQMQTRSADEPMTTFVSCTNCGNKWKFS